jgi:hypothetical protein
MEKMNSPYQLYRVTRQEPLLILGYYWALTTRQLMGLSHTKKREYNQIQAVGRLHFQLRFTLPLICLFRGLLLHIDTFNLITIIEYVEPRYNRYTDEFMYMDLLSFKQRLLCAKIGGHDIKKDGSGNRGANSDHLGGHGGNTRLFTL